MYEKFQKDNGSYGFANFATHYMYIHVNVAVPGTLFHSLFRRHYLVQSAVMQHIC